MHFINSYDYRVILVETLPELEGLKSNKSVTKITLSKRDGFEGDFTTHSIFSNMGELFPNVTEINLNGNTAVLEGIESFPNLSKLRFCSDTISDENKNYLSYAHLKQLQEIDLTGLKSSSLGFLQHLFESNLTHLNLSFVMPNVIYQAGILQSNENHTVYKTKDPNKEVMYNQRTNNPISLEYSYLHGLTKLVSLQLGKNPYLADLSFLSNKTTLKVLNLDECTTIEPKQFNNLKDLTKINKLILRHTQINDLGCLLGKPITHLNLCACINLKDEEIKKIVNLTKLQELNLVGTCVTQETLMQLKEGLTNLHKINAGTVHFDFLSRLYKGTKVEVGYNYSSF